MEENRKLVIAALVIVFGSNTTGFLNAYNPDFRADKFTGLDAAKLEQRILEKIQGQRFQCAALYNDLEQEIDQTLIALERHEVLIAECFRRVP